MTMIGCWVLIHSSLKISSVVWSKPVSDDFHARFTATARRYQYLIVNQSVRPAICRNALTWHYHPLCIDRMREAATYLVGTHDFDAYRAAGCQSKTSRS